MAHQRGIDVGEFAGCYPTRPRALKPENIEALVCEWEPGVFIVRLDDRGNDEMWLQFVVTVKGGATCKTDD